MSERLRARIRYLVRAPRRYRDRRYSLRRLDYHYGADPTGERDSTYNIQKAIDFISEKGKG